MLTVRYAIVGSGLAGLYAAYLLQQRGITDYVVLEARASAGGRIMAAGQHDLGATWFWPQLQPQLSGLIRELGLRPHVQHASGDMLAERTRDLPAQRLRGYVAAPPAMRLAGGMGTLVAALRRRLPSARLLADQHVRRLRRVEEHVELDIEDENGNTISWRASHVLLALPPRLAAGIDYHPALPPALLRQWRSTPTWMAPHAKYLAMYDHAFWREQGLSGHARSAAGPLAEVHDASAPDGPFALFGFVGLPAHLRQQMGAAALMDSCRAQLVRLFGPQAATPVAQSIKDWAADPHTATPADWQNADTHGGVPAAGAATGPWQGLFTGIASEWSPHFPGYLAGAVEAASLGVAHNTHHEQ